MAKLSVIVPIYNVEKYLRQCLESIVNQTFRDLEIILVDDGSPDKCGEICDEYAKKDNRIIVIHKANGGLSAARNDALNIATGEWIAFVDSDDWLDIDIYEKAITAGDRYDVDILLFNSYRNTDTKEKEISLFQKGFCSSNREYIKSLQAGTMCKYLTPTQELTYGYPWDRIIKREFIKKNELFFSDVRVYEDIIYAIKCFQHAQRIAFIEDRGYHYRFNNTSIGNIYNPDRINCDKVAFAEMFDLADRYQVNGEYYKALYTLIVESILNASNRCFFNKKNKNSFIQKVRYANSVIEEKIYYKAFSQVDRKLLTRAARVITIFRHHNVLLLYAFHIYRILKESFFNN